MAVAVQLEEPMAILEVRKYKSATNRYNQCTMTKEKNMNMYLISAVCGFVAIFACHMAHGMHLKHIVKNQEQILAKLDKLESGGSDE